MLIFAPKAQSDDETRAARTPDSAKKLINLGASITVESGIGVKSGHADSEYEAVGATVSANGATRAEADIVFEVEKPSADLFGKQKPNSMKYLKIVKICLRIVRFLFIMIWVVFAFLTIRNQNQKADYPHQFLIQAIYLEFG